MALENHQHSDRTAPAMGLNRFIEDRASRRPKILTVYFVNGGSTKVSNVTSVQTEPAAGGLNIRCRNGNTDIGAFNAAHIVGWVLADDEEAESLDAGQPAQGAGAGRNELVQVNAIKEAIGEGLDRLVADDEDRFRLPS